MLPDGSVRRCPVAPASTRAPAGGEATGGNLTDWHSLAWLFGKGGKAMPPAVDTGEALVAVCVHLRMSDFLAWLSGQA